MNEYSMYNLNMSQGNNMNAIRNMLSKKNKSDSESEESGSDKEEDDDDNQGNNDQLIK